MASGSAKPGGCAIATTISRTWRKLREAESGPVPADCDRRGVLDGRDHRAAQGDLRSRGTHDALVMVDDSHAVGFMGSRARDARVSRRDGAVDMLTGTLGKALGGASGGYTSGRREIVELLRQRSRPYLFSNTVAPPVVGGA
jgi:hypothetical protein